jgi:hypothetical protein
VKRTFALAAALTMASGGATVPLTAASVPVPTLIAGSSVCSATPAGGIAPAEPSNYYAIELVSTRRVPGTGSGTGSAQLTFARSPFGVSLSPTGSYQYTVDVSVSRVRPPRNGVLAVWVASADLDDVRLLGVLDDTFRIQGQSEWNKFLVIVSLEQQADLGDRWKGPIVMRGMSRSGMMHTMAGHGAFQSEPCAKYGYK